MRTTHEKNLSTKQPQAQTYPRVQGTNGDKGRPSRAQAPASQGPRAAHTLEAFVSVQPSATFSRRKRLTSSREFGRVFARPVRSTDAYFTVLARPGTCDNSRLGLAISKRVAKSACARNRLRRLSRETFRCLALPALDFVVMARANAPHVENRVLQRSLKGHFNRIARKAKMGRNG